MLLSIMFVFPVVIVRPRAGSLDRRGTFALFRRESCVSWLSLEGMLVFSPPSIVRHRRGHADHSYDLDLGACVSA